jgi:hypothetical protein
VQAKVAAVEAKVVGAKVAEANLRLVRNDNPNLLLENQTMFASGASSFKQSTHTFVRALPCFSARRDV